MALKATSSSTSVALNLEKGIPTTKQMIRSTSQRFKQSSSLLQEAIQVHEERERELLSTIQKLQEQIGKFHASQEEIDGKHQKECLIYQKKISDQNRAIEHFTGQFKICRESVGKICETLIRRQDQFNICMEACATYWVSKDDNTGQVVGRYASGHLPSVHTEVLKNTLDDEYKARIYVEYPQDLFGEDTKKDAKSIQDRLGLLLKECEALQITNLNP